MMILNEETISNPNFSIITPGPCNARCSFCFWKNEDIGDSYISKLYNTLVSMPEEFEQISITGGEPSLSPHLNSILDMLKKPIIKEQFKKVVLTSNGTKIVNFADEMQGVVDHVNISRHSHIDSLNDYVFGTNTVPNKKQLMNICEIFNNYGIDITLSAVLTPECFQSKQDILDYIEFAKNVGASAVAFRIVHGVLDEHYLEKMFSYIHFDEHNCGVCRHRKQLIGGMKVTWKASVEEPSNDLGGIMYEGIFNQNGILTKDWEAKHEVNFYTEDNFKIDNNIDFKSYIKESVVEDLFSPTETQHQSGCGISTSGCGASHIPKHIPKTYGCGGSSGGCG